MNTTKPSLGDRFAEITVILITILALTAGWFTMDSVQNRSVPFEANGIKASVPAGWTQSTPKGNEVLQVRDRASGGFETTYLISKMPLTADSGFNEAVSLLMLQRGQNLMAFRVLDQQKVLIEGYEVVELTYVYVESNPNVTHADLPVVVHGKDFLFFHPDGAIVISYRASEENFEGGLARFYRFLESIQF
jgi:hypothetical protein